MSPSATTGWYVVLHFSRSGESFYSTLGCAATLLQGGSLVPIDELELAQQVGWARSIAAKQDFLLSKFSDLVELRGNELSKQFEKATAFAREYRIAEFQESHLWEDIQVLCRLLVILYEAERQGKAPLSLSPEVQTVDDELATGPLFAQKRAEDYRCVRQYLWRRSCTGGSRT